MAKGTLIRLTDFELRLALTVGGARYTDCRINGRKDRWQDDESGWNNHIEGAAGEIAAAKALGMYWNGSVNTFQSGGDVGNIQIRTRIKPSERKLRWLRREGSPEAELAPYRLIVRNSDRDADVFVLVVSLMPLPEYMVVGWTFGAHAKRQEFEDDPGGLKMPAYFVPPTHSIIQPIETLRTLLET
jgi:hypothetical protein